MWQHVSVTELLLTSVKTQTIDCCWFWCACSDSWLMVEACILMSILVIDIYFVAWDDRQRRAELGDKARRLLARLERENHNVILASPFCRKLAVSN